MADLRGQVVLLEMCTFGCINCQRVIPHVREWHERYRDEGLAAIGNHYPEFDFEAELDNLRQAIIEVNVPYPVIVDNARETRSAYNSHYWPTTHLIDKRGNIRYVHIGEGAYAETEVVIQALLAEETPRISRPQSASRAPRRWGAVVHPGGRRPGGRPYLTSVHHRRNRHMRGWRQNLHQCRGAAERPG